MFLAVDIGNSQTSVGVFRDRVLLHHWRFETKVARTSDEYGSLLFPLFERAKLDSRAWDGVILCSVVPPADQNIEDFCVSALGTPVQKITHEMKLGFRLGVTFPSEVGADRLANAAYAVEKLNLPAIVVDFGTATTFDVISRDRVYEGGLILPGVRLSIEALSIKTSKLPWVALSFPKNVTGKNTVQCIQSGVLYGYTDMVDGLISRLSQEWSHGSNDPIQVALTGGLARLFESRLKTKTLYLPNLTLEGIELLYHSNRSQVTKPVLV